MPPPSPSFAGRKRGRNSVAYRSKTPSVRRAAVGRAFESSRRIPSQRPKVGRCTWSRIRSPTATGIPSHACTTSDKAIATVQRTASSAVSTSQCKRTRGCSSANRADQGWARYVGMIAGSRPVGQGGFGALTPAPGLGREAIAARRSWCRKGIFRWPYWARSASSRPDRSAIPIPSASNAAAKCSRSRALSQVRSSMAPLLPAGSDSSAT